MLKNLNALNRYVKVYIISKILKLLKLKITSNCD